MFYNGIKKFIVNLNLFYFMFIVFQFLVNINFVKKINNLLLNDSLGFLVLISSPIYTIFILIILYRYYHKNITHNLYNSTIIFIICCAYFFNVGGFIPFIDGSLNTSKLNTSLQNGLLNIHPYIIYVIYSLILAFMSIHLHKMVCFPDLTSKYTYNKLLLIFIGIILGAWWAMQEFNWGGLWSWDPVELISLLSWLYICTLLHNVFNLFRKLKLFNYVLVILIIYMIMRLGVVATIHSFIKNTSFPFFFYLTFLGFGFVLCIILITYYSTLFYIKSYKPYENFFIKSLLSIAIIFLSGLIATNFGVFTSYVLFKLNNIFVITLILYIFLISKLWQLHTKVIYLIFILTFATLSTTYVVYISIFISLILIYQISFKYNTLHLFIIWCVIIFTCFFTPINQFTKNLNYKFHNFYVTQYYASYVFNNFFEGNLFVNKFYFLLDIKSYKHHILSFTTFYNYIQTYFFSFKNSKLLVMYIEEFIHLLVYSLSLFLVLHKYNTSLRVEFY